MNNTEKIGAAIFLLVWLLIIGGAIYVAQPKNNLIIQKGTVVEITNYESGTPKSSPRIEITQYNEEFECYVKEWFSISNDFAKNIEIGDKLYYHLDGKLYLKEIK